ncbi:uncharacterized protein BKCO1_1230008 [Diplodia corticola]|uniref:Uncharacterized protein n=1 Tax=Diplodia corticola TaxID=236234 RepID=A0A1J9QJK0_9PEZI|nr:uncharacterized protein BKCO1_1230008 [Diplodia corticola]OJD28656.1 hypothetical protein BKCO1_1230008 [Diplodia corticola]
MEKAGSVFKSEKLEEKGASKRDAAAGTSHGGTGSYGRDNNDRDSDSYGSSRRHDDDTFGRGAGSDTYGSSTGGGRRGDDDDTFGSSRGGGGIGGGSDSYGTSAGGGIGGGRGGVEDRYDATNDRENEYGRTAADRDAAGYGGGLGGGDSYGSGGGRGGAGGRRDEY